MAFQPPYVPSNSDSWGPPALDGQDDANPNSPTAKFAGLPFAPFGRGDRLGRAADFTSSYQAYLLRQRDRRRLGRDGEGGNAEFSYRADVEEDRTFELVDTAKAQTRRFVAPARKRQQMNRLRQLNAKQRREGADTGPGTKYKNVPQRTRWNRPSGRGGPGRGGRGGPGRGRGGRGRGRGGWRDRVDRQASVSVRPDWQRVDEMNLAKISKHIVDTDAPLEEQDLLWCGFLDTYNDSYDRVSTRAPVPLKRMENKEFYPVSTTDDPVIEKLAIDGMGNVFATDAILAHLMTCPRSVYPWDIVVQKLPGSGALFFDKRDSSQFDYLTVNETANNPPKKEEDDPEGINAPERLGLEATMINQNFSQQILKSSKTRKSFNLPNPFFDVEDDDGMEPASVAYRYRRFDLGDDIQLVARTELHGIIKKKAGGGTGRSDDADYMTAFSLNEFDSSKTFPSVNWRDKIDSQRGAVLANELKNNSFKLAKWTAQSILSGAAQMKIGFVSRTNVKDPTNHVVLATQFYRPRDFAAQITLSEGSMWGLIRMLVKLFRERPDGKYVIMRDPNKAIMRIYQVPQETFESEDEDEDGEEEGNEE